jgi:hypothetical protein
MFIPFYGARNILGEIIKTPNKSLETYLSAAVGWLLVAPMRTCFDVVAQKGSEKWTKLLLHDSTESWSCIVSFAQIYGFW